MSKQDQRSAEQKERERRNVEGGVVDPETGEEFHHHWLTLEPGPDDVIVKSEPSKIKLRNAFTKKIENN